MRNLEETLKFDHGLTIGKPHPVELTLKDSGTTGKCTVNIPKRGYPRLAMISRCNNFLMVYMVKGDTLVSDGQSYLSPEQRAEWLALFENPVKISH